MWPNLSCPAISLGLEIVCASILPFNQITMHTRVWIDNPFVQEIKWLTIVVDLCELSESIWGFSKRSPPLWSVCKMGWSTLQTDSIKIMCCHEQRIHSIYTCLQVHVFLSETLGKLKIVRNWSKQQNSAIVSKSDREVTFENALQMKQLIMLTFSVSSNNWSFS